MFDGYGHLKYQITKWIFPSLLDLISCGNESRGIEEDKCFLIVGKLWRRSKVKCHKWHIKLKGLGFRDAVSTCGALVMRRLYLGISSVTYKKPAPSHDTSRAFVRLADEQELQTLQQLRAPQNYHLIRHNAGSATSLATTALLYFPGWKISNCWIIQTQ